jgi:glycosyltransferase involved in cell wall biosynthesis
MEFGISTTPESQKVRESGYAPLVSVIIPTFNRARQVQAALRSILTQTYPNFEVIVVDDGSTDETREAVAQVIDQQHSNGKRVRYFFQTNQGQSVARNKGVDAALGQWLGFLDSDDVWLPEKLEWQVRAVEKFKEECGACICDARVFDDLGLDTTAFRSSGKRCDETLGMESDAAEKLVKCRDPYWVSTLLVRTEVAKQIGSFDPHIEYAEDHDFLFRLSLATSFCYVNRPLAVLDRSKSPQNSTCRAWDSVEVRLRGTQSMFEKWLRLGPTLTPEVRRTVVRSLRNVHSAWTNWHLEHERYEEARQAARRGIRYELTVMLAIKCILIRVAPTFARSISPRMRVISGH